jgi:hypothetical protein
MIFWDGQTFLGDTIAGGSSAERKRGYLKSVAKSTWELVNWLTTRRQRYQLRRVLLISSDRARSVNVVDCSDAF